MKIWNFKEKILYQNEYVVQDSRKFEILIEKYLKAHYPYENWKLTKATRDGNRDLENICEFNGTSMWAEVKYTTHTGENLSSRKYDSTLVSSVFEKNLIKIFFITNASIGANLVERIKKFYYLSTIKKVAFVDGYSLAYWIKQNPQIETEFFSEPLQIEFPTSPVVRLQCIRLFCKNDSYTIDSVLEDQQIYPLYLSNNYILEVELLPIGFENTVLQLYCNDKLIYNDTIFSEIASFALDENESNNYLEANKEYPLNLYYILNDEKYSLGEYKLRFAIMGKLYSEQAQCYFDIYTGLKATYKKIYNIYGPTGSGKSWLLNNLKNDLLKENDSTSKIIYINFNGYDSDIVDICRLIFTLVFNYYNLSISANALYRFCQENSEKNSFFNPANINALINALYNNDYATIQQIIKGSIFSKTESLFEDRHGFAYNRTYFIDNIHLLNADNFIILRTILGVFEPLKNVSFVLTGREILAEPNIENVPLKYIGDTEILNTLNEIQGIKINRLDEILPQKHYLGYPELLHAFTKDISGYTSTSAIKHYYIDIFQKDALQNIRGDFIFDNLLLLQICFVKNGIPMETFQTNEISQLPELFNKHYIIQKYGYVYPNLEKWNQHIPKDILADNKCQLIDSIMSFMERDVERKEIYQCALMQYYPEYYNQFFEKLFLCCKESFNKNKYNHVVFLCETLLAKKDFYIGDAENIDHLKYFLAFSYMHCDASKDAQKFFEEVSASYQLKPKKNLYFDAESEIIDAKYWSFCSFNMLPKYIHSFRKNWKEASDNITDLKIRPYLTATNRMMVTYLALDCMELAQKWFKKNIKLAVIFNSYEHIGYTYMDYAKGIYHKNLSLALKYLQVADSYFQGPGEHRRHLDCQCEIQYVKLLLGSGNEQQLLVAQEQLFENQYWIQYYKCYLKLAVYYTLKNKRDDARRCLMEAEAPDMMKNDERIKYLCSIVEAFLYKEPIQYKNASLEGTSYGKILKHGEKNVLSQHVKLYNDNENEAAYLLDPRAW